MAPPHVSFGGPEPSATHVLVALSHRGVAPAQAPVPQFTVRDVLQLSTEVIDPQTLPASACRAQKTASLSGSHSQVFELLQTVPPTHAAVPQSTVRDTLQLSTAVIDPQTFPPSACRAQKTSAFSGVHSQTFALLQAAPPTHASVPQSTILDVPQLSAAVIDPQTFPSPTWRAQKASSFSGAHSQVFALLQVLPPQAAVPQSTVLEMSQLSRAITVPQTFPEVAARAQNVALVSGSHGAGWLEPPPPPHAASKRIPAIEITARLPMFSLPSRDSRPFWKSKTPTDRHVHRTDPAFPVGPGRLDQLPGQSPTGFGQLSLGRSGGSTDGGAPPPSRCARSRSPAGMSQIERNAERGDGPLRRGSSPSPATRSDGRPSDVRRRGRAAFRRGESILAWGLPLE